MSLKVEKINIARINEISNILIEKAKYLDSINKNMWKISRLSKNELLNQYADPLLFLVFDNDKIIGCFILTEKDDKNWLNYSNENAYYLHRLTVKTEYSGLGYSNEIISWIKEYAKENGKLFVRIDYDKKREYLDKLYKLNGFLVVGEYDARPGLILTKSEYQVK